MIEAKNITKSFNGREVLKNVSFIFERGKTNLIIGQSGSGKTVLMRCLVGLIEIITPVNWGKYQNGFGEASSN